MASKVPIHTTLRKQYKDYIIKQSTKKHTTLGDIIEECIDMHMNEDKTQRLAQSTLLLSELIEQSVNEICKRKCRNYRRQ